MSTHCLILPFLACLSERHPRPSGNRRVSGLHPSVRQPCVQLWPRLAASFIDHPPVHCPDSSFIPWVKSCCPGPQSGRPPTHVPDCFQNDLCKAEIIRAGPSEKLFGGAPFLQGKTQTAQLPDPLRSGSPTSCACAFPVTKPPLCKWSKWVHPLLTPPPSSALRPSFLPSGKHLRVVTHL